MKSIYVFGHKNPDIDSVCSAIAFADLKNHYENNYVPKVIGPINHGTKYVLDYFNIDYPSYLNDVRLQIKDIKYSRKSYINEKDSILNTFNFMKKNSLNGIPLVDDNTHIKSYITMEDIAKYIVSESRDCLITCLEHLTNTLNAKVLTNYQKEFNGKIQTITFNNDDFIKSAELDDSSILIVGDRYKVIEYAINSKVQLIILTRGRVIPDKLLKKAIKNKVNIITSSYSTFELCNRLTLANYVSIIETSVNPPFLELSEYYDDFMGLIKKNSYSNYPIVNKKQECLGVLKLSDIQNYERKKVILVDHNNYEQSIEGLNEAEIIEIIDHHNLGNIGTNLPISFVSRPVGCTATIVYDEYKKSRIKPSKSIAGLLLSAIISDTLLFTSPTTTDIDKVYAKELATIAKLDLQNYGMQMLKEASSVKGLSINELINQDFKTYSINEKNYGIAVITTMDFDDIKQNINDYVNRIDEMCNKDFQSVLIFIVDIFKKGSYVLYNKKSKDLISNAFNLENPDEGTFVAGLLSRKQQILPALLKELER